MKLQIIWMRESREIEVTQGEFNSVRIAIEPVGESGITMTQVEALSLARIIEELVKDIRRQ